MIWRRRSAADILWRSNSAKARFIETLSRIPSTSLILPNRSRPITCRFAGLPCLDFLSIDKPYRKFGGTRILREFGDDQLIELCRFLVALGLKARLGARR